MSIVMAITVGCDFAEIYLKLNSYIFNLLIFDN
jgi:hypothetical protein